MKPLLIADLFCGAGGSSEGARRALLTIGRNAIFTCINHWDRAIETHSRMHPEARHYCQDVASVRPLQVVPEGYLDLLMASPTCVFHSRARGGRPTSDQQRADPWHIVTWLTELRVKRLIIENVPEFVSWGPVDVRTGKPIKSRQGEYFREWIATMQRLGFKVEWRIVNFADLGDPTTRRRFMLMARSDGKPIVWPEQEYSKDGAPDLFGAGAKRWKSARDHVIDWSLKGRSIFNRPRPLSPKTMARIYAGIIKFGWPTPFIVVLRNHMAAQGVDLPLPAITAGGTHLALAQPIMLSQHGDRRARSVDRPVQTVTSISRLGVVEPATVVDPILVTMAHGDDPKEANPSGRRTHSVDHPIPALTAGGGQFALAQPFLFPLNQSGDRTRGARDIAQPTPTITASGTDLGLVDGKAQPMADEAGAFVLSQASGGAPRSVEDPVPTIPTGGAHALITPYYGSGSGLTGKSVNEPLDTVTTKDRFAIVVPVTHTSGKGAARSVEAPIPTITTAKGSEHALVMPVTHNDGSNRARDVDQPIATITTANRGELALAEARATQAAIDELAQAGDGAEQGAKATPEPFITAAFGERDGQAARNRSVDHPAPTVLATGRVPLVEGTIGEHGILYQGVWYDIHLRMLHWRELARAMSFSNKEMEYAFAGNATEITRQIGNAIPVEGARAFVKAAFYDLEPASTKKRKAAA
jgi:DNA (cytosine-5)-methyltransferase 1